MRGTFEVQLTDFALRAHAKIEDVVRQATLALFRSIVLRSPVDTGRFRANWNVSYGAPDVSVTLQTDEARALREIEKVARFKLGDVVYISNGLPYARLLEYGWSRQSPQGMVRLSIAQFPRILREKTAAAR